MNPSIMEGLVCGGKKELSESTFFLLNDEEGFIEFLFSLAIE